MTPLSWPALEDGNPDTPRKMAEAGRLNERGPSRAIVSGGYAFPSALDGKTPVWSREDAKTLLDSIPKDPVSGLRDLALIGAMFYSFACVSAVLKL
jgi:hypothetical protein